MIPIAVIVEGYGDNQAVPALIAKCGQIIGRNFVAANPIRAGEWPKIKRAGELERLLELAYSRSPHKIIVFVDLDDLCAADEQRQALVRVNEWKNGRAVEVGIVFAVREYESIFLCCIDQISDHKYPVSGVSGSEENFRGAKAKLKELTGRRYKETQDQLIYTKKIDTKILILRSRSVRKLFKELSNLSYLEIDAITAS